MKNEYTEEPEESQGEPVEIYSKQAIFWFSVLFNPIFGGALLMQNLRDAGYKKEAFQVLVFSILGFGIPQLVLSRLGLSLLAYGLIGLSINFGLAYTLIEYFFPKYFPDDDYYPKSIWRVLFRCITIVLIIILLSNYLTAFTAKVK